MLFWFLVCTAGRRRTFQMIQHRRPCAFGNNSLGVCLSLSVDVEQSIQLHQTGIFASQFFFIKEWLSDFLLCRSLLLTEVIQLCLCRLQTLGHLSKGIVDTGKISARVCTKGCPVGHLSLSLIHIFLAAHPHPEDGFAGMEIRGDLLTDKENAGAALLEACKEVKTSDPVQIGNYRGYAMSVEFSAWKQEYTLLLKGCLLYTSRCV